MKDQIKIRKKWFLDPVTKVVPSKKFQQRFEDEEEQEWKQYQGRTINEDVLAEIEDKEDDKQD